MGMTKIRLFEVGLIGKIAHCICQNLIIDTQFDVVGYFNLCVQVLEQSGLGKERTRNIMREAIEQGYREYEDHKRGSLVKTYGGSSIHPAFAFGRDALALKKIIDANTSKVLA